LSERGSGAKTVVKDSKEGVIVVVTGTVTP